MDSCSRWRQCSCVNLHTATIISLWLSLFISIIFVYEVAIGVLFRDFGNDDMRSRALGILFLWLTFECAPVVVGLCGLRRKNPTCLKVPVLFVLIHTGILFRGYITMFATWCASDETIDINSYVAEFVRLLILWLFAFIWYKYAVALNGRPKEEQNMTSRDVGLDAVNNDLPQPGG